jgi:hypothetical protein
MRFFALMLVCALAGVLACPQVSAAPVYSVTFTNGADNTVSSAAPFSRDSTLVLPPSNGDGFATVHGFANKGRVGATTRIDVTWWNDYSGAFNCNAYSTATTDDFLITGPASPGVVTGSLHLRLSGALSLDGGFPGNGAHASRVGVAVNVRGAQYPYPGYAQTDGDYRYTNGGPYSSGCLAGASGPSLDVPITLTGSFPVNTQFSVSLRVDAGGTPYGNGYFNPGLTLCDAGGSPGGLEGAGLKLESVDGQIMTLPAGYTLDSPDWGIVDNGYLLVGVGDTSRALGRVRLDVTGPNPFVGGARLALYLPRASTVRVTIFDVSGRVVRTLANDWQPKGRRDLLWDGRTDDGAETPTGLYLVNAEGDGGRATLRLVRLR